jgi:hypothetical protein
MKHELAAPHSLSLIGKHSATSIDTMKRFLQLDCSVACHCVLRSQIRCGVAD